MSADVSISTDKNALDIPAIHRHLSERSYWARGINLETVRKALDNSLCFGVYDAQRRLLGFGRVVTDYAVFAYLMDVFVLEEHRGRGLGKMLLEYILEFPELANVNKWQLATADAHGLYEKYGFGKLEAPEKYMEKRRPRQPGERA